MGLWCFDRSKWCEAFFFFFMSASHVSHCILTICIHHVIKALSDTHCVCDTQCKQTTFLYEKTQPDGFLFNLIFFDEFSLWCRRAHQRGSKLCSWCATRLVGLGECVFVSVLPSLAQVSRMFNYTLCHFSRAERGFVMAGLVCFLLGLTAVQCFSSFFSLSLSALSSNLVFFESNGQTLTLRTLWKKCSTGAASLTF